jgi:hypothetical protein
MKARILLADVGVGEKIILKWILEKGLVNTIASIRVL